MARPGLGVVLGASLVFGLDNIFCTVLECLAREHSHKGVELWLESLGVESGSSFWGLRTLPYVRAESSLPAPASAVANSAGLGAG